MACGLIYCERLKTAQRPLWSLGPRPGEDRTIEGYGTRSLWFCSARAQCPECDCRLQFIGDLKLHAGFSGSVGKSVTAR